MCYEFSDLFERARARQPRKVVQREQAQQRESAPSAPPQEQPEPKPVKADETVPV
jgi:hypothetical protein